MPTLTLLRDLLQRVPGRLDKLSKDTAGSKPTPSGWSPKEELGHLLDSAANNHQRIVRALGNTAGGSGTDSGGGDDIRRHVLLRGCSGGGNEGGGDARSAGGDVH